MTFVHSEATRARRAAGDPQCAGEPRSHAAPRREARRRSVVWGGALASLLALGGCQEVLLASDPAPMIETTQRPGVVYSLPTGLLPVTIERAASPATDSGYAIDLRFGTPLIIPDETHTYTLAYQTDSFSSDRINVKTGGDGLLQSISTTSRDEAASVAGSVVRLAGELAKAAATFAAPGVAGGPPLAPRVQAARPAPAARPFRIDLLVDPFDPGLTAKVADELFALGYEGVTLEVARGAGTGEVRSDEDIRAFCATGACYRRAAPVALRGYDEATRTSMERTTLMPNNGVVGRLDFERRAFVENQATALFDNGMLVEVTYNDPSSAAAAASTPVDLVASIVEIPARALGAQSSQLEEERRVLAARQSLIDQQLRLLETERRLREAEREDREARAAARESEAAGDL